MKRIIIAGLCLTMSIATFADGNIILHYDDTVGKEKRDVWVIPTVIYDENRVTIKSDSVISDAHVIITGDDGTVIHEESVMLSPAGLTIVAPDTEENRKQKIEIVTDERTLYGYFE